MIFHGQIFDLIQKIFIHASDTFFNLFRDVFLKPLSNLFDRSIILSLIISKFCGFLAKLWSVFLYIRNWIFYLISEIILFSFIE